MEPQDLVIMAQEETAALPAQQSPPTFQGLMDRFLAEADISDNSKQTYRRSLRQFFNWYEAQGLTTASLPDGDPCVIAFNYPTEPNPSEIKLGTDIGSPSQNALEWTR